jgi:hypothetical protein
MSMAGVIHTAPYGPPAAGIFIAFGRIGSRWSRPPVPVIRQGPVVGRD